MRSGKASQETSPPWSSVVEVEENLALAVLDDSILDESTSMLNLQFGTIGGQEHAPRAECGSTRSPQLELLDHGNKRIYASRTSLHEVGGDFLQYQS